MRVLGLVAALALLNTLPPASAQAPDPSEVVDLACSSVGGVEPQARELLPICPRAEPAPAPAADEEPTAEAAPAAPSPQDAEQLVGEIAEDAKRIPEDPASAGERAASIVATIVQFVKDILGLPAQALGAFDEALRDAVNGLGEAGATALDAARGAAVGVVDAVKALFDAPTPAPASPAAPLAAPTDALPDAGGLLDRVARALPVDA